MWGKGQGTGGKRNLCGSNASLSLSKAKAYSRYIVYTVKNLISITSKWQLLICADFGKILGLPLSTPYSVPGVGGCGVLEEDAGSTSHQLRDLGSAVSSPSGSGAEPQPKLNLLHFSQKSSIWHKPYIIIMADIFTAQTCVYSCNLCVFVCVYVCEFANK